MIEDRIRVTRVVVYEGPRSWVEETVARAVQGTKVIGDRGGQTSEITAVTLGRPVIVDYSKPVSEIPND